MEKHKKDRSGVSLMASEIAEDIKKIDGLCTKKFKADILTDDIDYTDLKTGDILDIDGKKIKLTKVGKPCFPECPLPKDQKPCILNRNVAFGEYVE